MVDQNEKHDRQQEQTQRRDRIKGALADFFQNSLPNLRRMRGQRDEPPKSLFPASQMNSKD